MNSVFSGKYWSIQRFVSGFANNAFLITCARTNDSVIIDTPADPIELIKTASNTGVEAILITHGHRDHVEGFPSVSEQIKAPVGIGTADQSSLPSNPPATLDVSTGQTISIGDIRLRSLATPDHTPGYTCFVLESPESNAASEIAHVFTGDTLFPGGPGRSSSSDALSQIIDSLKTQIFTLPKSTVVLPDHGEFTTIGESKREFDVFTSKPLDPGLHGDVTWV